MAFHYCKFFLLLCLTAVAHAFNVRVLLDEQKPGVRHRVWRITTQHGVSVSYEGTRPKRILLDQVTLAVSNGTITINGKPCRKKNQDGQTVPVTRVLIKPIEGDLGFGDCQYEGIFEVSFDTHAARLINSVELEDYLYAVLRAEGWPGWTTEYYKVQAIVSRSYVIAKVLEARKSKAPYHIKNTNHHQMYQGVHDNILLRKAVEYTRGLFLAHDGRPILAMFDSCCGGIIPALMDGLDFTKAPYLARDYACTYCKSCKLHTWQATFNAQDMHEKFQKHFPQLKKITNLKVSDKDGAGLVNEVQVHDGESWWQLTGKQFYSLFAEIKSFCFSIIKRADKITLSGKGYGHHVGLCQWGAMQMIKQHHNYLSVLRYYFPGTSIMKLQAGD